MLDEGRTWNAGSHATAADIIKLAILEWERLQDVVLDKDDPGANRCR